MNSDALPQDNSREDALAELVTELFEKYAIEICNYIHALVDNWEVAYDLTQDTFLRLFRTRQQLRNIQNHRAWIYRIATNVALNTLRRRRRFLWLPWHLFEEEAHFTWSNPVEDIHESDAVERCIVLLSLEYRIPLVLAAYYGFSIREIAEMLDIKPGAAKTRLYRARKYFREVYEKEMRNA